MKGMVLVQSIRPFVLLISLMFWQGGFMFYGGVVVPVGSRILGSDTQQGFITQAVTNYLNLAGLVCLFLWTEHLWHERRRVSRAEWGMLGTLAGMLMVPIKIHWSLDRLLDSSLMSITDPRSFGLYHKIYIGTSSGQWFGSLVLLFLAILRWNKPAQGERKENAAQ